MPSLGPSVKIFYERRAPFRVKEWMGTCQGRYATPRHANNRQSGEGRTLVATAGNSRGTARWALLRDETREVPEALIHLTVPYPALVCHTSEVVAIDFPCMEGSPYLGQCGWGGAGLQADQRM